MTAPPGNVNLNGLTLSEMAKLSEAQLDVMLERILPQDDAPVPVAAFNSAI